MTNRIRLSLLVGAAGLALVAALASTAAASSSRTTAVDAPNYAGVKTYLLARSKQLVTQLNGIQARSERYYALAKKERFSYPDLWRKHRAEVSSILLGLKPAFSRAHKAYEEEEGIIAGVPSLAQFDVIMDSGTSAAEDPQTAVPFDLRLPNGKVFAKPGNFFHALLEPTVWGTDARFVAPGGAKADLDRDGTVEFGEVLPDANALKAAADAFVLYAGKLDRSGKAWKPTPSDAFTSVVVMVPTMSEYFGQWKTSRFVLGDRARSEAFNVVSRLSDIGDILGGLLVIYAGIRPSIAGVAPAQAAQTTRDLDALHAFVARLRTQERAGRRFTPQQADVLGRQAQERATAIAGQVSQAAAELGVTIEQ